MPHPERPCGCRLHDCKRPTAQKGWVGCRSCSLGWHAEEDCGEWHPEPWNTMETCATCGVEKSDHSNV